MTNIIETETVAMDNRVATLEAEARGLVQDAEGLIASARTAGEQLIADAKASADKLMADTQAKADEVNAQAEAVRQRAGYWVRLAADERGKAGITPPPPAGLFCNTCGAPHAGPSDAPCPQCPPPNGSAPAMAAASVKA